MEKALKSVAQKQSERRVAGGVLIGLGALFLAAQLLPIGNALLPLLALGFIGLGIGTRTAGWLIPGGVIGGIALGARLSDLSLVAPAAEGGVFLLSFALGWATIYVLSRLFTDSPQSWALIPAGIMTLIGGAVLFGEAGERFLELFFGTLAYLWPIALLGAGAYLLLRARRTE